MSFFAVSAMGASVEITDKVWKMGASVQSESNPVSLINDGNANTNAPYWSTLHGEDFYGTYEYVELQWETNCVLDKIQVYWATEDGDINLPTDAYIAYWNGKRWVKSVGIDGINRRGVLEYHVEFYVQQS